MYHGGLHCCSTLLEQTSTNLRIDAWSRDLGWSFSPAIPSNQSRLPEWNQLDTLASSCHSIDDFQDAEKANELTLSTLVNEVFDELLIKNAAKADEFGKSSK